MQMYMNYRHILSITFSLLLVSSIQFYIWRTGLNGKIFPELLPFPAKQILLRKNVSC